MIWQRVIGSVLSKARAGGAAGDILPRSLTPDIGLYVIRTLVVCGMLIKRADCTYLTTGAGLELLERMTNEKR